MKIRALFYSFLLVFLLGCKPEVSLPPTATTEVDTDPYNLSPIQLTNSLVDEYSPTDTTVGFLQQVQGETVTYTLVDDNGGMFDLINGNEIVVLDRTNLDYEISTTEDIMVQATSATQGTRTDTLSISVANVETEIIFSNVLVNPDADPDLCNYTNSWVRFDVDIDIEVDKNVSVSKQITYPFDNNTILFTDFYGTYTLMGTYNIANDEVFNLSGPATASNVMIIRAISSDGYEYSISVNCLTETFTVF